MHREVLGSRRRVIGPEYPQTAFRTYHLGVIAANRGNRAEALSVLRQAFDHGLFSTEALGMEKDPDLKSLQGDPRFDALVAYAENRATAAQTSK